MSEAAAGDGVALAACEGTDEVVVSWVLGPVHDEDTMTRSEIIATERRTSRLLGCLREVASNPMPHGPSL